LRASRQAEKGALPSFRRKWESGDFDMLRNSVCRIKSGMTAFYGYVGIDALLKKSIRGVDK
jgi:hypothetical protein